MSRPSSGAPPSLQVVQSRFYQLVTAPQGVAKGMADAAMSAGDLGQLIVDRGHLSAVARLDIYASMYFYRILDVLRGDYPKLLAVLGADLFHNLITDYLRDSPPAHPSIRNAGERLPDYLAAHSLTERRPWLRDLARLERTRIDLFDAPDVEPLQLDRLRALAPEEYVTLSLPLVAAHRVLDCDFAVDQLWNALEEALDPAEPTATKQRLLVWRQGLELFHRPLDEAESDALALVREGAPFGVLCDRLATEHSEDEAAQLAFTLLARWVSDELIAAAPQ